MSRAGAGGPLRGLALAVAAAVVAAAGAYFAVKATSAGPASTTSTAPTTSSAPPARPSGQRPAKERPQAGWKVASASARGVMVDYRNLDVGGVVFRAVRMRARTTLLRWHVGSGDPNLWAKAPPDAGPSIDWPFEGAAGVVAVFNGAFKQSSGAGGAVVDGLVLEPLLKSHMTIALDAAGHWAMGIWGAPGFPPRGFTAIAYRQNLGPLVLHGRLTPEAFGAVGNWGSPLGGVPAEARTGLGVDANGNLIYVATMTPILPPQLGEALVKAGVVTGMELDINPFWPILGASFKPVHNSNGQFPVQLPHAQHSPTIYVSGWERDFFVALAEPNSWSCYWSSVGLHGPPGHVVPQPLRLRGRGCRARR
jgi:hypothetical protein